MRHLSCGLYVGEVLVAPGDRVAFASAAVAAVEELGGASRFVAAVGVRALSEGRNRSAEKVVQQGLVDGNLAPDLQAACCPDWTG